MLKFLPPLALALAIAANAHAAALRVAAASDLKFALDQIKTEFTKAHPGAQFEIVYGSSGQFEQQIEKGAPFDLFLSADESYPKMLVAKNITHAKPFQYGIGTLVLWSKSKDVSKGLDSLKGMSKIAIANPDHAPYGRAAKAALEKAGLYDSVKSKIVLGDSISQTAQFAASGAADAGLIALALAKAPAMKDGQFVVVKEAEPLKQSGVVLKPDAQAFADYLMSAKGQATLKDYGFKGE